MYVGITFIKNDVESNKFLSYVDYDLLTKYVEPRAYKFSIIVGSISSLLTRRVIPVLERYGWILIKENEWYKTFRLNIQDNEFLNKKLWL